MDSTADKLLSGYRIFLGEVKRQLEICLRLQAVGFGAKKRKSATVIFRKSSW